MAELTPFDEGYEEQEAAKLAAAAEAAKSAPDGEPKPAKTKTRAAAAPVDAAPAAPVEDEEDDDPFKIDFDLGAPRDRNPKDDFQREKWGLFPDMDPADYYADPCDDVSISQSGLRKLLGETPMDFAYSTPRLNREGAAKIVKSTMQSRRGDVVHQLLLGKGKGYAIGDFKAWQSKDAKAFKADAEERGETPILRDQFRLAVKLAEVGREKLKRMLDGADYQTEVPFVYQVATPFGPIWVRGMMDVWCPDLATIVDPKITPRLYEKVDGHMVNMGWDVQKALYTNAVGTILGLDRPPRFADLMIKPEAPFTTRMVTTDKPWNWSSWHECERGFNLFASCLYNNQWDGFPNIVEALSCPMWEAKRREEIQMREPMK